MNFRPLHDRVVIRRLNAEERTTGGIIIPDTAQEKPMQGEVIAVGPGARNDLGSRSRDTRVESVAQISGLQKTDSGRVSMTWQGARLPQSPP